MSRQRVVTGTDARGRPKATWTDPEADTGRGYGHMEPAFAATIERRQATPDELAAARAREVEPTHLTAPSLVRPVPAVARPDAQMQASRQRGAERHVEVLAARKADPAPPSPSPEEKAVSEAAQDLSTESPEPAVVESPADHAETIPVPALVPAETLLTRLDRLQRRARTATEAWEALVLARATVETAEARWQEARELLVRAYREADTTQGEPVKTGVAAGIRSADLPDGTTRGAGSLRPTPRPEAAPRAVDQSGDGPSAPPASVKPGATSLRRVARVGGGMTLHEQRIVDAVVAHDGDRRPVATELSTSDANVVATLERVAKRGLLPAALFPKMPKRFAKYSGAPA